MPKPERSLRRPWRQVELRRGVVASSPPERRDGQATGGPEVTGRMLRDRCPGSSEFVNFQAGWLHTYLTLRNGAKRSVPKGGNRHGAYASRERGSFVLRVPILRDAPLRYAPQHEVKSTRRTIHSQALRMQGRAARIGRPPTATPVLLAAKSGNDEFRPGDGSCRRGDSGTPRQETRWMKNHIRSFNAQVF